MTGKSGKNTLGLMKRFLLIFLPLLLVGFFFSPRSAFADTLLSPLDIQQLSSNSNGQVTFKILNPPAGYDFTNITALASWDNQNWVYANWYEGGCPEACVVEWQGQNNTPFYIKLTNQSLISIIFNQSVYGGAFSIPTVSPTPIPPLNITQLSSNGNGQVTFKILNPPADFNFTTLSASASWDNVNWVYANWYEGGCPDACMVEWPGQNSVPFYVRLTNQLSSITFNQSVFGGYLPPTVNSVPNATINEGGTYNAADSFTDSSSTSWTATMDYGDGSGVQSLSLNSDKTFNLSHVYKDDGTYTVTVKVTDNQGSTGAATATITVNNVAPTVGVITAPSDPQQVNTSVGISANFTDPGVLDTHAATIDWGDSSTSVGTITESNGSGTVSGSHTYATAGVYTVGVTVTDNGGLSGSNQYQYVVVYNPNGGFATGAGAYNSPVGSYAANFSASGRTKFGLSAKYVNNVLQGSLKLNFKDGGLDFASTTSNWLVVTNGNQAQYQGTGSVNGTSGYTFLVTAVDNSATNGQDTLQVVIKDSSNTVVYDSQTQNLTTGVVTVHN